MNGVGGAAASLACYRRQIYSEPGVLNSAPQRMIDRRGFGMMRARRGASSPYSRHGQARAA